MKLLISILISLGIVFLHHCKEKKKDNLLLFGALAVTASGSGASETVATPTFSPAAGNQTSNGNITISTTTSDATIYYTTDGTTPTTSSTKYSTPLVDIWSLAGKTIQAIAVKSGWKSSGVLSGVFSIPPLKTGQTTVNQTGDDGTYQSGIDRSYTDNGDGTVRDNATGLIWQRCSRGQNNDSTCSGTASKANWTDARAYCSGLSLAGRTWRLPSRQELLTLLNYGTTSSIDQTAFPSTPTNLNSDYWSSTTYVPDILKAWGVKFADRTVTRFDKSNLNYVRCVSGAVKQEAPGPFVDNGDGTVTDRATGLIWQKCSRGQNNNATCSGTAQAYYWHEAITYCSYLNLAGRTWRLPSVNELLTLTDTSKTSAPAIDTNAFPNAPSPHWSSTGQGPPVVGRWMVDSIGSTYYHTSFSSAWYVRCVSGP